MRRRFRQKPKRTSLPPRMRANEKIFADPIVLIDQADAFIGEISLREARALAESVGLDLVEVSPKANPPVCKILDYGKFQYNQAKQFKQSKALQKIVVTKGVRLGIRTDDHDRDFKKKQSEKFLTKGNKVKIEIILRGREKAHQDLARKTLQEFVTSIETPHKIEEQIKKFPGGFNVVIAPE